MSESTPTLPPDYVCHIFMWRVRQADGSLTKPLRYSEAKARRDADPDNLSLEIVPA